MFETIAQELIAALHGFDPMAAIGVFTVIMATLFVVAMIGIASGRGLVFCRSVPSLLTTLGILGTFLGIASGLLDFDVSHIEYSIPQLLNGLKVAFVSSIVGILLAICLRLALTLGADARNETGGAADGAALAAETDKILTAEGQTQVLAEAQLAATQQLAARVAQLDQRLIDTLERQQGQVLEAFAGFATQLGESGSRQLIQALESVIRDFNTKLGEQFGENFRHLDAAVVNLLRWQEEYREQLRTLGRQFEQSAEGVALAETTLRSLTEQALRISQHVDDQASVLGGLRRETMELEALLGGIAELRDKARDAFPAMDRRLTAMLENLESAMLAALGTRQRLDLDGGGAIQFRSPVPAHPFRTDLN